MSSLYFFENANIFDKSDVEFLKKNKVLEIIRESLLSLSYSKPDDPFQYLINYFSNEESQNINLGEIERELLLVDFRSPLFQMTLQKTYQKFLPCSNKDSSKTQDFVSGELIMDFVKQLLRNTNESATFLAKIILKPYVHVTFSTFRYLIMATLSFKEYMKMSNQVFDLITDSKKTKAKANHIYHGDVLHRISQWLDNYSQHSISYSNAKINNRFLNQNKDLTNRDKFNKEAAAIFLQKVEQL